MSLMAIGFVMSDRSESFSGSIGISVPRLDGTALSLRHSWLMRSSLAVVSCKRSQRSAFIILPISETTTFRNLCKSMFVGKSRAKRSIIASRASCILIFRSSENVCGLSISIFIVRTYRTENLLTNKLITDLRGGCQVDTNKSKSVYFRFKKVPKLAFLQPSKTLGLGQVEFKTRNLVITNVNHA